MEVTRMEIERKQAGEPSLPPGKKPEETKKGTMGPEEDKRTVTPLSEENIKSAPVRVERTTRVAHSLQIGQHRPTPAPARTSVKKLIGTQRSVVPKEVTTSTSKVSATDKIASLLKSSAKPTEEKASS